MPTHEQVMKLKQNRTANRRLAKVAVSCFADRFVVAESNAYKIKFSGKFPHLCQSPLLSKILS